MSERTGRGNGSGCSDGSCGCGPERGGPSRRDFLKVLGVSGAGAATLGCTPEIADELIPYLVQHEEIVPGVGRTYATSLAEAGPEPLGVWAQVRDGRVIKLEGNPRFPTNRGRLSALAQSALQDLYDPDRVPSPMRRRAGGEEDGAPDEDPRARFEEVEWEAAIASAAAALGTGPAILLTGAATGATARLYREWAEATGVEHVPFEALGHGPLREATRRVFGRDVLPAFHLELADRIVCFGADFLGTWLAPVEMATGFAEAREVEEDRYAKFTYVGPHLPITGTNADEWLPARPGSETAVVRAVTGLVGGEGGVSPEAAAEASGIPAERIRALAEELRAAAAPVALPPGFEAQGPDATEMHVAVARLNQALGAVGTTLRLENGPIRGASVGVERLRDLVERMRNGEVETLVVSGSNPAFSLPGGLGFGEALAGVGTVIHIGPHLDETAALSHLLLPSHHMLEAWGDVEVRPGLRGLAQPVMQPLWDTRQREDILIELARAAGAGADFGAEGFAVYLQDVWREEVAPAGADFDLFWREALRQGGVFDLPAATGAAGTPGGAEGGAAGATAAGGAAAAGEPGPPAGGEPAQDPEPAPDAEGADAGAEAAGEAALVVYPSAQFFDGRGANRPWMQELPDPVTKIVWGSWIEIHPEMAERLGGLERGDVLRIESEAGALEAPVHVWHGVHPEAVAIPIGQGHEAYGRYAAGRGVNPLRLLPARADAGSGALALAGTRVRLAPTGRHEPLINRKGATSDYGREIGEIEEASHAREEIRAHRADPEEIPEAAWDSDPKSPYRWGMTIDLNACTGCGACVTACYAENNIPWVGPDDFAEGREMSWLRINRFFHPLEEEGAFETVHTPMLCQHCGDAPCEPVCPVYAAYHTAEGLNAQVYNRCVGTRYCSNNCPYKVRRFNWFTYEWPYPLNLQLNPAVTVREKGVMEKCTFCVQRIVERKLDAKDEGRLVQDGEIQTACQQTCPTNAIVFGNLKDPSSRVATLAKSPRSYGSLSELGTRPAVHYLTDVTAASLGEAHHEGGETPLEGTEQGNPGEAG